MPLTAMADRAACC